MIRSLLFSLIVILGPHAQGSSNELENLSCLVVGLGPHMTKKLIPEIQRHFAVLYGSRRNKEALAKQQVELSLAGTSTNYKELLKRQKIDAVFVAGPPMLHISVAREAYERGIPVFAEKPLSQHLPEIEALNEALKVQPGLVFVGLNLMHLPLVQTIKPLVDNGYLHALVAKCTLGQPDAKAQEMDLQKLIHNDFYYAYIHAFGFLVEVFDKIVLDNVQQITGLTKKNEYGFRLQFKVGDSSIFLNVGNYAKPGFNFTVQYSDRDVQSVVDIKAKNTEGISQKTQSYAIEIAEFVRKIREKESNNLDKVLSTHRLLEKALNLISKGA